MATRRPLVLNSSGEASIIKSGDFIEQSAGGTGVGSLPDLKTALALNNVENKSSNTIRSELTSANVVTALGFTPSAGAGGGITYVDLNIDFGSNISYTATMQVADASATTSKRVFCSVRPDSDEYEMDTIVCQGYCKINGIVTIMATAHPGPVIGIRKITYWLG